MKETTYAIYRGRDGRMGFIADAVLDHPMFSPVVGHFDEILTRGLSKEEAVALSKLQESANDSEQRNVS